MGTTSVCLFVQFSESPDYVTAYFYIHITGIFKSIKTFQILTKTANMSDATRPYNVIILLISKTAHIYIYFPLYLTVYPATTTRG